MDSAGSKVFISELIVIVIINALTLVAFARNRHLRKRSTYYDNKPGCGRFTGASSDGTSGNI